MKLGWKLFGAALICAAIWSAAFGGVLGLLGAIPLALLGLTPFSEVQSG